MTTLPALLQGESAPETFGVQDFHGVTTIHPLGLAAILGLSLALLALPRRYAVIPFLLSACLIPASQRVVVATLDFNLLRILVLAGWARLALRGEYRGFTWRRLDTLVLAWSVTGAAAYAALHGTLGALVYRAGTMYDALGLYLFFRCVIRRWADLEVVVRSVAYLAVPIALVLAIEKSTGRNAFAFLGGVPEQTIVREGRLRVQGPFPHAILAGCFFAVWLPLVAPLLARRGRRLAGIGGSVAILLIVVMCASSTPVGGVFAAVVGLGAWSVRRHMRSLRWAALALVVGLHLVMQQPVWHLLSRVSFSSGSTSYHRFLLIDNTIRHAGEWLLIGARDTSHWGPSMYDLTNQFVVEAVRGGLLTLVLFVAILAQAFALVGGICRRRGPRSQRFVAWGLGASLAVHVAIFMGVSISYSQQALFVFFFVLASVGSLSIEPSVGHSRVRRSRPVRRQARRRGTAATALEPAT